MPREQDRMRNAVPPTITRDGPRATYTVDGTCLQSIPPIGRFYRLAANYRAVWTGVRANALYGQDRARASVPPATSWPQMGGIARRRCGTPT